MTPSRRDVIVAGAFAFGASALLFSSSVEAQGGDEAAVAQSVETESELDGKATTTRIGALQVWQTQDGTCKLLARQGFGLPA